MISLVGARRGNPYDVIVVTAADTIFLNTHGRSKVKHKNTKITNIILSLLKQKDPV